MPATYQHEVDIEIQDLVTHVHTVGVREVIPQVGESPRRALEMGAGNLHALTRGGGEGRKHTHVSAKACYTQAAAARKVPGRVGGAGFHLLCF